MTARFVLGWCSNINDKEKGISIHASSFYDNPRPETRKMRRFCGSLRFSKDNFAVRYINQPRI